MGNLFRGDNTAAFGGNFLKINLTNESGVLPPITRAELKIGCIRRTFENPTFPMMINLSEDESEKLQPVNNAYLALWDADGRKKTCQGTISILTNPRRV